HGLAGGAPPRATAASGGLLRAAAGLRLGLLVLGLGLALRLGGLGRGLLLGGLRPGLLGFLVGGRLWAVGWTFFRGLLLPPGALRLGLLLRRLRLLRGRLLRGGLLRSLGGLLLLRLLRSRAGLALDALALLAHRILALSPPACPRNIRVGA